MNTSKLNNNKYHLGKFDQKNDYNGWFVGSFFNEDHPCKTDDLEIMYAEKVKGYISLPHFHEKKVELLIMLSGKAKYLINDNEVILESGNFLFVDVNNVISGEFLESSKIFAIHSPSIVTDKVEVKSTQTP